MIREKQSEKVPLFARQFHAAACDIVTIKQLFRGGGGGGGSSLDFLRDLFLRQQLTNKLGSVTNIVRVPGPHPPTGTCGTAAPIFGQFLAQLLNYAKSPKHIHNPNFGCSTCNRAKFRIRLPNSKIRPYK